MELKLRGMVDEDTGAELWKKFQLGVLPPQDASPGEYSSTDLAICRVQTKHRDKVGGIF